jgi:hypothetical protein
MECRAERICSSTGQKNLHRYALIDIEELAQTISNKKYLFKAINNQKEI